MSLTLLLLFGSIACDVSGQVCFKLGIGKADAKRDSSTRALFGRLIGSYWVALGILIYVVEFVFWFAALSRAPLSFAFPIAALSYVGVVLASRWVLREDVPPRRWLGIAAIVIGVVLVSGPQIG